MRTCRLLFVLAGLSLVVPRPGAALDVTGRWLLSNGGYADLAQSGTDLEFAFLGGYTLSGTIDLDGSFVTFLTVPGCELAVGGEIVGETRMVGSLVALCAPDSESSLSGIRCECFDGNSASGDGCDAHCQIEPCFTCSGEPSACVPSADGAACDDRSVCTSGETCSAGTCGGGSPVTPCLDLSGQWLEHLTFPAFPGVEEYGLVNVQQVGTILEFNGSPFVLAPSYGTIDPVTGAMEKATGVGIFFCPAADVATGTAALDGNTYGLSGTCYLPGEDLECGSTATAVTATRCVGPCALPTTTSTSTSTTTSTSTSTTTTTAPLLLSAKGITLKDAAMLARRGFTLGSKDPALAISGSASDDPTLVGATLRVRTAAGCGGPCDATYSLPPDGWQALGENEGHRYVDPQLAAGPVKTVMVKPGKTLKIVAKGDQLEHALASDPTPVDVVLTFGAQRMCFRSGGTTKFTQGKKFSASNAPAPTACP
jgi:cysteine-rich repeat protein